jgi:UTP--glucose-1-phosphate uridylyltransferase
MNRSCSVQPIRKAVIPVAGLGTRLLPFTKAIPKEMLPVGNKPLIQHAVEEAVSSGIEEIILVAAPGRDNIINKYFCRDLSLENRLEQRGRHGDAERIRSLSCGAKIRIVYQDEPLGLGHAVGCARELVGGEPFALILPDALILGGRSCLRQLIGCYQRLAGSYVATREVGTGDLSRFGILQVSPVDDPQWRAILYRVTGLVEKPAPGSAPSRFGIFGRYLLEPEIFGYLERVTPDENNEIQITDALALYCRDSPLYAFCFEGDHYDAGNKLGFLQSSVAVGLSDPETGEEFRRFLVAMVGQP